MNYHYKPIKRAIARCILLLLMASVSTWATPKRPTQHVHGKHPHYVQTVQEKPESDWLSYFLGIIGMGCIVAFGLHYWGSVNNESTGTDKEAAKSQQTGNRPIVRLNIDKTNRKIFGFGPTP